MTGWRSRNHPHYWAFVVHRVSGLALAVFLPIHFWVLALAIEGEAALDEFLTWTEQPLVKAAEVGLIVLLVAHMTGGLRLLTLEFLPWSSRQGTWVFVSGGLSMAAGLLFLLLGLPEPDARP